jgi:fucose 4-O-acetylase-like acetyltransferase
VLRARYLLVIGILFHFQMWATAFGQSEWANIFKVDILNCMAVTIALLAPLALLNTQQRVRYGALAGFAIACGSPFVTQMNLSWMNPFLRNYFVPSHSFFSLFPWGAFVAFGLCCGSVLRQVKEDDLPRVMPWAGLIGLVLISASRFAADLPFSLYPKADFWLDSPLLILIKLGVILLISCWAFLMTRYVNPHGWSFVRQLGTTSLLVYWVHTELVYGRWLGAWKEALTVPQTVLMAIFVIASMTLLSVAKTGWQGFPGVPTLAKDWWASVRQPAPAPSAGD